MFKLIENRKKRRFYALVAIVLTLILGVVTKFFQGGIFGEEKIYLLLGGSERNSFLLAISKILAFIGSAKFLIPAIVLSLIVSYKNRKRDLFIGLSLSSLGVYLFNSIIKNIIRRPRPVEFMLATESSFSYPSGHAMVNTCLYLFIAYYLGNYVDRKNRNIYYVISAILSLVMGLSRIYLGVHYISDVIGGFLGGYFFFVVVLEIIKKLKNK